MNNSTNNNLMSIIITNRNPNLTIFTAPTKAKFREPAYSHALNQNKINRQRVKIHRVRQAVRQLWWMMFGVETGREAWGRG